MEFEWDPAKSVANQTKHGIDFTAAVALWQDENRMEIPARITDEPRSMVIGRIGDTGWSAIITYRGSVIRIVSVRRSRSEEVALYEGESE